MKNNWRIPGSILGIVTGSILAFAGTAAGTPKVTICHAAGQEGTTQYVTLNISVNAVYGPGGHFNENGTTQAGHEQDYLGPCIVVATTTTDEVEDTTTTVEDTTTTEEATTTTVVVTTTEAATTTTTTVAEVVVIPTVTTVSGVLTQVPAVPILPEPTVLPVTGSQTGTILLWAGLLLVFGSMLYGGTSWLTTRRR